jgi:hypothetical protein
MKDQTDLESRSRDLYPASPHLQAQWLKAVTKVRTTAYGWRFDTIRKGGKSAALEQAIAQVEPGRKVIRITPESANVVDFPHLPQGL